MSERKSIVITGGGAGIGRASALHFHGLGWRVAALDKDGAALAELAGLLPASDCLTLECDVGVEDEVEQAFAAIGEWLGDAPLTCLVNNAGIADPYAGPLEGLALDKWQAWIDASLTGAFLCSRAAVKLLRRAEGASIVNISSTRAVMSEPESFAYAAAKGGVDALTHAMAVSLGPDIRVNAIRPGWIETRDWQKEAEREDPNHRAKDREQHPAGRVGRPQDIAEAIEYLAGAGFVTGQHVNVDGGMTVKMIYEH
ncbi:SDR family oxidoreductase [Erythrobacter sp. LQ02-29]|uniref:SDR family NAD(P)-dependent oxidoreductase n=1 Tax=Erythrobacter sp. LQ02-29 TaxID=2920384 RepID=UPI001F4E21A7|nr:SDR family oxidoreductase [Erythrobacter sp. LQ02-29]MCP9221724.1 SDR family oxidoreductase [Erythrobacter sp. LQ02-29]